MNRIILSIWRGVGRGEISDRLVAVSQALFLDLFRSHPDSVFIFHPDQIPDAVALQIGEIIPGQGLLCVASGGNLRADAEKQPGTRGPRQDSV